LKKGHQDLERLRNLPKVTQGASNDLVIHSQWPWSQRSWPQRRYTHLPTLGQYLLSPVWWPQEKLWSKWCLP
jgi:hypothetical protein